MKRKLYADEPCVTDAIVEAIQAKVLELRKDKMTGHKRQHYKFLTNAANRATGKYLKIRKRVSAFLGIGGKVTRNKKLCRKKWKDVIPESTKILVRRY